MEKQNKKWKSDVPRGATMLLVGIEALWVPFTGWIILLVMIFSIVFLSNISGEGAERK